MEAVNTPLALLANVATIVYVIVAFLVWLHERRRK